MIQTESVGSGGLAVAKSVKALPIKLDAGTRSEAIEKFDAAMHRKIIGQDDAVTKLVHVLQQVQVGLCPVNRPLANLLFVGPTGCGKTRIVEAAAETLYGSPNALIKIDCAEFQHSHEIAKLIGSPPGYLGHRETAPMLTQEAIDQYRTPSADFSFLLFDEIEKANDALWRLLLGIMDKGRLTLGDNRRVNMDRTIIIMTSNLGAREMARKTAGRDIGFLHATTVGDVKSIADVEIKRKFDPEFINRLDDIVVFNSLTHDNYRSILDLEMNAIQSQISVASYGKEDNPHFYIKWTNEAAELLLDLAISPEYGARELKRILKRQVVIPLSNLIATGQVTSGETVFIDMEDDHIAFFKPSTK